MRKVQAAGGTSLTGEGAATDMRTHDEGQLPSADSGFGTTRLPLAGRRRIGVLIAVAVAAMAADIVSKAIVVATLSGHPPIRMLGGFLTLIVSRNPGAAFSIGPSLTVVFTAIAVGVIVIILRTSRRIRSWPWAVSLGLLLGGATGNLSDRLLRSPGPLRGHVVDWIMLPHWPVFNLADSSIVCGGVLAVLLAMRGLHIDGSKAGAKDSGSQ